MTEEKATTGQNDRCLKCGKRIAHDRRPGSLTSYLFAAMDCRCSTPGGGAPLPEVWAGANEGDDQFCPKCGLALAAKSEDGRLTGFLFQSTRCKCSPDPLFADGQLSSKFFKLKQEGSGNLFESVSENGASDGGIGLAPGATIGGVYKIIKLIGRGGMGEVYLAKHSALSKKCVLKVMPPSMVTEVGWLRFQLEARSVARLEHINLVQVTDLGIHDGCLPYYAMEFVDGQDLSKLLAQQGTLPLDIVLEVFKQVCDGVEHAHRSGILHRDLKPGNIMVGKAPDGKLLVKVLDFGLAKLTGHDREKQSLTAVGEVFGSPYYMSPEQCYGHKLDNRSDIYSLGCTMFECLTGRPPFIGERSSAVAASHIEYDPPSLESIVGPKVYPTAVEVVIAKLLRKNPAERYQNLSQFKSDLELLEQGKDVLPVYLSRDKKPATAADSGSEKDIPVAKSRAGLWLSCGLGLAVTIVLGGIAYFQFSSQQAKKHNFFSKSTAYRPAPDLHLMTQAVGKLKQWQPDDQNWDGKPFYKGTTTEAGTASRKWLFPTALAKITSLEAIGNGTLHSVNITSHQPTTVVLPLSQRLCIGLTNADHFTPELYKGFSDGCLDELGLHPMSSDDVNSVIPHFARFKSIKGLRVGNSKWTQDDIRAGIGGINQLVYLDRLLLMTAIDGPTLRKIRRLPMLQDLRLLDRQPHLHSCLEAIGGSQKLRSLTIVNWAAASIDLPLVVRCTNIEHLMLDQFDGTHQELRWLARLPHLKELKLPCLKYRADLVNDLQGLMALQSLSFTPAFPWTEEQIARLGRELPGVTVRLSRSDTDKRIDQLSP